VTALSFRIPLDDGQNRKLRKEFTKRLSERLREIRKAKKLTQQELAEKAGLHRAYFWDIENGRNISIKTAYKVARALGVKLSELFDF